MSTGVNEQMFHQNMHAVRNVVLLCCGSFNPITTSHCLMFKAAKQYLEECCESRVIAGIISPVNDKYSRKNLVESHHRIEMICRALKYSNFTWIHVDDFESKQTQWMRTLQVLQHIENSIKKGILLNDIIENKNNVSVKLLCGADLIETFSVPNLWKDEDIEEILTHYGIVVIPRKGWNPDKYISEHRILKNHIKDLVVVKSWEGNEVSATKVREKLENGESVEGLIETCVLEYIKEKNLYTSKV